MTPGIRSLGVFSFDFLHAIAGSQKREIIGNEPNVNAERLEGGLSSLSRLGAGLRG